MEKTERSDAVGRARVALAPARGSQGPSGRVAMVRQGWDVRGASSQGTSGGGWSGEQWWPSPALCHVGTLRPRAADRVWGPGSSPAPWATWPHGHQALHGALRCRGLSQGGFSGRAGPEEKTGHSLMAPPARAAGALCPPGQARVTRSLFPGTREDRGSGCLPWQSRPSPGQRGCVWSLRPRSYIIRRVT